MIASVHVLLDHIKSFVSRGGASTNATSVIMDASSSAATPLLQDYPKDPASNIIDIVDSIQTLLHSHGVHNTTVQPEFLHTKTRYSSSFEQSSSVS